MMRRIFKGTALMNSRLYAAWVAVFLFAISCTSLAQQSVPNSPLNQDPAVQTQAPRPLTTSARLAAAKTVYLVQGSGNSIPYNVISSGFESWPRYTIVETRQKADLIVEILAPEDPTGVSVQGTTIPDSKHPESKATTSRSVNSTSVKMMILDPRTGLPLWSGSENPRGAMKKRSREDNLVEAAQKLFAKFRDHMEPPQPESTPTK